MLMVIFKTGFRLFNVFHDNSYALQNCERICLEVNIITYFKFADIFTKCHGNKANLRDLIAATGLVILLKLD